MAALMHFWQKMWPQTVDAASVSSFMQIGQLNFGSFGTSFTGSGGAWINIGTKKHLSEQYRIVLLILY
jgi:hypothetical protein